MYRIQWKQRYVGIKKWTLEIKMYGYMKNSKVLINLYSIYNNYNDLNEWRINV